MSAGSGDIVYGAHIRQHFCFRRVRSVIEKDTRYAAIWADYGWFVNNFACLSNALQFSVSGGSMALFYSPPPHRSKIAIAIAVVAKKNLFFSIIIYAPMWWFLIFCIIIFFFVCWEYASRTPKRTHSTVRWAQVRAGGPGPGHSRFFSRPSTRSTSLDVIQKLIIINLYKFWIV